MLDSSILKDTIITSLADVEIEQDGETIKPFYGTNVNTASLSAVIQVICDAIITHITTYGLITGTTTITGTAGPNPVVATGTINPDGRIS